VDTSSYQEAKERASFGLWATIHPKVERRAIHGKIVADRGFTFALGSQAF